MNDHPLRDTGACVFDAYGTLLDVHSAVQAHHARLGTVAREFSDLWRTRQLEYTWLRSLMQRHADFHRVTADALDFTLETFAIDDAALRSDLMDAYLELSAYPEVAGVLDTLAERGLRTAVLSNGSPQMLSAALAHAGLAVRIGAVLSVEEVGIYKPHPSVYRLAERRLALPGRRIAFVSGNAWDVAGAASHGLGAIWLNRTGQKAERLPGSPVAEIKALDELPSLLGF